MSDNRKKIAMLVEDAYQDLEVWYPVYRLREAGMKVPIVGTGREPVYRGKFGIPIGEDRSASHVTAEEIDGVIIPGGYAPDILRRYDSVLRLVKGCFDQGKVVASICHGAWVLVSAKICQGRQATCYCAIKDDLINAGADYVDAEVVRDGNLITSRKPDDLPAFCRTIQEALNGAQGKNGD